MEILDNGLVSIRFTLGTEALLYHDALVMTQDEYNALTPEQITAMQQARYDAWCAAIVAAQEAADAAASIEYPTDGVQWPPAEGV